MARQILRIASVRARTVPRIIAKPASFQDVIDTPTVRLSRRQVLGVAGAMSFAASPLARGMSVFDHGYTLTRRGQRVAFVVAGVERWVLDPSMFDGAPHTEVVDGEHDLTVRLHDALYPGTDVRADVEAVISKAPRPAVRFTHAAVDGVMTVDFLPWLLDAAPAVADRRTPVALTTAEASLGGIATATEWRPSWTLRFDGHFRADMGTWSATGPALHLTLLTPDRPTLFMASARRRSLVRLDRGGEAWVPPLALTGLAGWTLATAPHTFDTLTVETADDGRCAALLEGTADGAMRLTPADVDLALPLRDVRYAWSRSTDGVHETLVASYSRTPVWFTVQGVGLEVGDDASIPPLEITSLNGAVTRCVVAPAFHRYLIPLEGVATDPTRNRPGSQLAFLTSAVKPSALPKLHMAMAALQIDVMKKATIQDAGSIRKIAAEPKVKAKIDRAASQRLRGALGLPGNPKITVIRPDDLMVLTFEFSGATLNRAAGTFGAAGADAKLIVHFQPQHIAERAFFSAENKPSDTSSIPDRNKQASSTETPLDPPIDAVLAHGSRLVFSMPAGHSAPLSIESLLDWSRYTLAVSPSAKPPKTSFVLSVIGTTFNNKYSGVSAQAAKNTKASTVRMRTVASGNGKTSPTVVDKTYTVPTAAVTDLATDRLYVKNTFETNPDFATTVAPSVIQELANFEAARPPIREPKDDETAIEYPYRVILSPNKYAAWAHKSDATPSDVSGRVELWHTRLATKTAVTTDNPRGVNEEAAHYRTMRAIWSPDYGTSRTLTAKYLERPFRTSLNRRDRSEVVDLTSNYNLLKTTVAPIDVRRFMLTSLGAWADMVGAWDPHSDDQLDVEQWIQRGAQGRDTFVRVCYKGFLFPFGHRATLVKETERKFRRTPRGHMAAYLIQRLYIILRQPVRDFPADGLAGMRYQGRDFPFRRIEITTRSTPNLEIPTALTYPGGQLSANSFWPRFTPGNGGGIQDVAWSCIGTDWDGNRLAFSTPLTFLANTDAGNEPKLKDWVEKQYVLNETARRTVNLDGQVLAWAPSAKKGDTALPTTRSMFSGYYSDTVPSGTPRYFPCIDRASVRLEQVQELLGTDALSDIRFYSKYLEHAFDPGTVGQAVADATQLRNPSQLFVQLLSPVSLDFGANTDKAGGLAAPSLNIDALSRLTGPISAKVNDLAQSAAAIGKFDPMEYFKDFLETKILGDIKLIDLLKVVGNILNNLDSVPGLSKKDSLLPEDAKKALTEQAQSAKAAAQSAIDAANALANDIEKDVKDARDALKAELQPLLNELNQVAADAAAAKRGVEERLQAIKKKIEDRVTELRSEIEKTMKPLVDAGNEAYKKYSQAKDLFDQLKQGIQLVYEWQTEMKSDPLGLITPLYPSATTDDQKMILYLKAQMIKKLDLNPPQVLLFGSLRNFIVNLIGNGAAQFLIIKFNRLSISATIGQKPDIDPDIEGVEFAGPLSFVNKLKDLIPRGGSAGGVGFSFDFDVSPKGVSASLTIGLPNVTVGVFSLQNMAFLMRLTIPFDGTPFSAYFAFCTKENPFRLTIMVFGGGGFFGIEITPKGVKMLEAAFEFGGNFAFDCGVASGGASVMAGVYYKMEQKEIGGKLVDQAELTGYFRLTGNLSVLGLIRVSLLFELKLTWMDSGKVYGVATIEVEIEILFISFSVGVTVERQLKGSDGDPTFQDMLPEAQLWAAYCESFA